MWERGFQPSDPVFDQIQHAGSEFGATTGRVRQCNWISMRHIKQAIDMNGVNNLVVNKLDVLREVEAWKTTDNHFQDEVGFRAYLQNELGNSMGIQKIYFSDNPYNFDEENPLTAAA